MYMVYSGTRISTAIIKDSSLRSNLFLEFLGPIIVGKIKKYDTISIQRKTLCKLQVQQGTIDRPRAL